MLLISNFIKLLLFFAIILSCTNLFADGSSDAEINKAVKDKLSIYNQYGLDVQVKTNNGVISLVGDVNSVTEAKILIEIAQSVPGVKDVKALRLTINQGNKLSSDEVVTAKIRGIFIREKIFGEKISDIPFDIQTTHGVVHLDGKGSNKSTVERAIQLIHSIPGVKDVTSQIKLLEETT